MYASAIAKLINAFNVTAVSIAVCLALAGALVIIVKASRFKIPRVERLNIAVKALCVAALAAFALEATALNFPHYLKYFTDGPPIGTTVADTAGIVQTTDGTHAELIENGIRFNNINRKVTSVYVDIVFNNFDNLETVKGVVKWTDETATQQYAKVFYKYLPHENYALFQPCGKVSEITITFDPMVSSVLEIKEIVINKPIPFYFSGLRLLVFSLLFFALFAFVHKDLRAKAAYYLFEYGFDPKNKRQNIVYACTVALLIVFSGACVYTSVSYNMNAPGFLQYNKFLVDALINGRTYLNYGNPQKLLNAERPYDTRWLNRNGYEQNVDWMWDWAWYKGKHYCYFGVIPAVLLYLPYKMITGDYLSNQAGIFLFCAIAVILLAVLWRYCVKKYMRNARYAFYLLSFLTLFFASYLFVVFRLPYVYCISQSSGFMFTVAGILLLLKSVDDEKVNRLTLFFACLCFALVFGCRPNMGLASILVPLVLWKYRTWRLAAFAMLPYVIVAIPICLYNYIRFESIFEFGAGYNLTDFYSGGLIKQNALSKIFKAFILFAHYLFDANQLSLNFPFVKSIFGYTSLPTVLGALCYYNGAVGLVNFPIVFLLFYLFDKNKPKIFYALSTSLIIAVAIIVLDSIVVGCTPRYALDFALFIVLPSLFCAYYWCQDAEAWDVKHNCRLRHRVNLRITYALMTASIFVGLLLCVSVEAFYSNPTLYRYLEYSLDIFKHV